MSDPAPDVVITHPAHPLRGRAYPFHFRLTSAGVPLICCVTGNQALTVFPVAWTNYRPVDDFERVSAGRSLFRVDDLEELRDLVDVLLEADACRNQE